MMPNGSYSLAKAARTRAMLRLPARRAAGSCNTASIGY